MRVIRADVMGMCFGVRDALKMINHIDTPESVTIHGELVHNGEVLSSIRARGFAMTSETQRSQVPETPLVLITAHGVSDRERARLEAAGKQLVDTTCPLVKRAHQAAQKLRNEGYFVLVVGRQGHVEVIGLMEDLDACALIEREEDVRKYPATRLGILCQTTTPEAQAARIRQAIARENPGAEIRYIDTICQPTKDHQQSLINLLEQVEAVVVVGGRQSNNTRELVTLCQRRGTPALHVQSARELDPEWFRGFSTVGLTAGTSTLESTIDDVYHALMHLPELVGSN